MAFAITSIVIAGSATLIISSLWGNELLRKRYSAAEIAGGRIENLRSVPYQSLTQMEEEDVIVNDQGTVDSDGDFTRSTEIGNESNGSREVTVTVHTYWRPNRDPVEISISTIIADDALIN